MSNSDEKKDTRKPKLQLLNGCWFDKKSMTKNEA
jgi:hypothetical protein